MPNCNKVDKYKDKIVLKAEEKVTLISEKGNQTKKARIDTGASMCSIDKSLADNLELGPPVRQRKVKSATGRTVRDVYKFKVELKGKQFEAEFTVIDRGHMSFPVLIGRNIIKQGFIVDVS
ncbi:MAG: hypothetical protein MAG795_01116 [Candidatus Woesearchaeota archaeon]|nr:hypothetical protein [Candidatus Woesearchaeota archaeon]